MNWLHKKIDKKKKKIRDFLIFISYAIIIIKLLVNELIF